MANENDKKQTLEQLAEQISKLTDDVSALKKENLELKKSKVAKELKADKPVEHKLPTDKFKVGNKNYKFKLNQFRLSGYDDIVYADVAIEDEALLQRLAEMGSGVIEEVK